MNTHTPDTPHDAATDTLRTLGHVPGAQPVRQLRQVAAEALGDAAATPDADGADAGTRLLKAAVAALGVLTEADLDEMEQEHLAKVFGLDQLGGAGGLS